MENVEVKEQAYTSFDEEQKKRPRFLTILCILSFISIGAILFSTLLGFIKGPLTKEELDQTFSSMNSLTSVFNDSNQMQDLLEKTYERQRIVNSKFYLNALLQLIVYAVGLFGVLKMWKMKKIGFHLYIIYSLGALSFIYAIVPINLVLKEEIIQSALLSLLFVIMYARNLKVMD